MIHRQRNLQNQATGRAFEDALAYEAHRCGVMAVRNGQRVRWLAGGRAVAVRSNLDWTLLCHGRPPAFIDSKSFQGARFGRSLLPAHQVVLALRYLTYGALAGFLVHLRKPDVVAFYSAEKLSTSEARAGYGVDDGLVLGTLSNFSLDKLWQQG